MAQGSLIKMHDRWPSLELFFIQSVRYWDRSQSTENSSFLRDDHLCLQIIFSPLIFSFRLAIQVESKLRSRQTITYRKQTRLETETLAPDKILSMNLFVNVPSFQPKQQALEVQKSKIQLKACHEGRKF